jgi:hypothetical protein
MSRENDGHHFRTQDYQEYLVILAKMHLPSFLRASHEPVNLVQERCCWRSYLKGPTLRIVHFLVNYVRLCGNPIY